jgi:hypothetical protein
VPSPSVRHPWTLKDLKNGGKRVFFLINVNIKICLLVDSRVEAPRYKSSLQAATFCFDWVVTVWNVTVRPSVVFVDRRFSDNRCCGVSLLEYWRLHLQVSVINCFSIGQLRPFKGLRSIFWGMCVSLHKYRQFILQASGLNCFSVEVSPLETELDLLKLHFYTCLSWRV